MSRSFLTHAAGGFAACKSEKEDKRLWHKRWRAMTRDALAHALLDDEWERVPFSIRQASNPWQMSKDGKAWYFPESWRRRERFLERPGTFRSGDGPMSRAEAHKLIGK